MADPLNGPNWSVVQDFTHTFMGYSGDRYNSGGNSSRWSRFLVG